MRVERVGYGAGARDNPETPNVLRLLVGRDGGSGLLGRRVVVLECEIDDMNPQIFGVVMDRLYARRRARRVLRAGADEEEPAGHAADGRRSPGAAGGAVGHHLHARRRPSGCGTTRWSASVCRGRSSPSTRRSGRSGSRWRRTRRARGQRRAGVRGLRAARGRERTDGQGRAGARHPALRRARADRGTGDREPLLSHHRDRLRQQPAASRDGVREGRRRRHRPLQAAVRRSTRTF